MSKLITIPEMEVYMFEDLKRTEQADIDLYKKCCLGFPGNFGSMSANGKEIVPYGSSPVTVQYFRTAILATGIRVVDLNVLEIGFNIGFGTAILLELGCKHVTAFDVSDKPETISTAALVSERFGKDRFRFLNGTAPTIASQLERNYDLCHIDGDHESPAVEKDIQLCKTLGVKWMLFDDWWPLWGPGVQPSVIKEGLHIAAIIGNKGLCTI